MPLMLFNDEFMLLPIEEASRCIFSGRASSEDSPFAGRVLGEGF
jgi:hypothetical protein